MFKKFGGALKRLGRKAKIAASLMSVAAVTAITTVVASAAGETTDPTSSSASDLATVISSAGNDLKTAITTLVSTLSPILISVSVSGFGIYAVVMLFKLVKKMFSKAAG